MKKTNVIELNRPAKTFEDPLTDIIRNGARKILMEVLETEIELFLELFKDLKTEDGIRESGDMILILKKQNQGT